MSSSPKASISPRLATLRLNSFNSPVKISLEKAVYYPGDTVIGRLHISNLSHIRSIWITTKGETKCTVMNKRKSWQTTAMVIGPTAGSTVPDTFEQRHVFLNMSQNLFKLGDDSKMGNAPAEDSAPVNMEIPFFFDLPTHQQDERPDLPLPSSYELPMLAQKRLEIIYTMEADVKRNGLTKINKKENISLRVKSLIDALPMYEDTKMSTFTVPLGYTGTPFWLQVDFTTPKRVELPPSGNSEFSYSATYSVVTDPGHEPPHHSVLNNLKPLFKTYLLRRTMTRPEKPSQGEEWKSTGDGIVQGSIEFKDGSSVEEKAFTGTIKLAEGEVDVKSTCCEVSYVIALQVTGERIKGVGMTRNAISFVYVGE